MELPGDIDVEAAQGVLLVVVLALTALAIMIL